MIDVHLHSETYSLPTYNHDSDKVVLGVPVDDVLGDSSSL